MAGSCWRLLAVCVLIFITSILAGQDGAADRSAADGRVVVPILSPQLLQRRDPPASAPIWIPAPRLPRSSLTTPANPGLPQDVFQQLIRTAGIIFSGRVQSVGHATPVPRAGNSS